MSPKILPLLSTVSLLSVGIAQAQTTQETSATELDPMVVIAPQMNGVLNVSTDPKAPRQPIPAQDGADLLKNIPGFAVTRKGGSDGDPLFRGMAASRLGILLDGEMILGGCGGRMDPPTAYVFPEAYDRVTILKGPQSVKYGSGTSAGVVMFERTQPDFSQRPIQGYVSLTQGNWGRNDQVAQLQVGSDKGYVELSGTRSDANNYEDGAGNSVHSAYTRWSTNAALGWTPTQDILIELTAAKSDGEARYADRGMDGSKFARQNLGLRYEQRNLSPIVQQVNAHVYRNYVDHVMDNFSLRPSPMMPMLSNPDRDTQGASFNSELALGRNTELTLGLDWTHNQHRLRRDLTSSRATNMIFDSTGLYAELDYSFNQGHSLHSGLRINREQVDDERASSPTRNQQDEHWLTSGFLRYEHALTQEQRLYAGLGHSQRAADFWERNKYAAGAGFFVAPEKTTQLDIGWLLNNEVLQSSVSMFIAQHDDYILIDASQGAAQARNIRARTYGLEADARWQFARNWYHTSTLAWVQGENLTDNRSLGQMPAPEMRLGLSYETKQWNTGIIWRLAAEQDRVAEKQGNIVGQDIAKTSGFNVLSWHAGFRYSEALMLTAGIDNLFDTLYAEHISKSGADIAGYEQTKRVNEPGRTVWAKLQWRF